MRNKAVPALIACSAMLAAAGPATASVSHTVTEGETLWSIASANGISTATLAAANGLSPDAQVVLGSTILIPGGGTGATAGGAPPAGAYTVAWGDTLASIAARSGISVTQLALMNGLDPAGVLVTGAPLKVPAAAATASASSAQPSPEAVPQAAPNPTGEFVSSSQVAQAAANQGVSGSLAAAIAHQESGFNNSMVSSANARGVMQITPGTWDFIQGQLANRPLNPSSATDNVEAGAMYLSQLLRDTGGDESLAAAAYYQGLGSVRSRGVLPETQRYVDSVMALRGRYGG